MKNEKSITIKIPTKEQIFTKKNFRAFMFLVIAAYAVYAAYTVGMEYYPYYSNNYYISDDATVYDYTIAQLDTSLSLNVALINTIRGCFFWLCWFIALVLGTLGIIGFSFKKSETKNNDK